jgi:hypothetical protein
MFQRQLLFAFETIFNQSKSGRKARTKCLPNTIRAHSRNLVQQIANTLWRDDQDEFHHISKQQAAELAMQYAERIINAENLPLDQVLSWSIEDMLKVPLLKKVQPDVKVIEYLEQFNRIQFIMRVTEMPSNIEELVLPPRLAPISEPTSPSSSDTEVEEETLQDDHDMYHSYEEDQPVNTKRIGALTSLQSFEEQLKEKPMTVQELRKHIPDLDIGTIIAYRARGLIHNPNNNNNKQSVGRSSYRRPVTVICHPLQLQTTCPWLHF